jgi:hypothetical protein
VGEIKKKVPKLKSCTHKTTSHKTEHHWEKMESHGGNLWIAGEGEVALEKMQPPQWEPDGLRVLK